MATITEDYVSFETAKLLKEKGFPQNPYICNTAYTLRGKLSNNAKSFAHNFAEFDKCGIKPITYSMAPTLQMAMKWLREDKKILISIFCHIDKGYWFCIQHFINSPYKFATSESIHRKEEILGKIQYYDTYEQACDAAIKYCLENLI